MFRRFEYVQIPRVESVNKNDLRIGLPACQISGVWHTYVCLGRQYSEPLYQPNTWKILQIS